MTTKHLTKGQTNAGRPVCGAKSTQTIAATDAGHPRGETPVTCKRCLWMWRMGMVRSAA